MNDITLFHTPGACSRVTMSALEEIGIEYATHAISIAAGEQKQPAYLAINPKGKVPALKIGNDVLTESAAILHYLNAQYPGANLLPSAESAPAPNRPLEDLVWCSATVHPNVRQIRMPVRYTDSHTEGVKAHGMKMFEGIAQKMAARVASAWWYGSQWSIVDVYVYWNYSTAASGGFDLSPYPALLEHSTRVRERPSFKRALAKERAAVAAGGIQLPPGTEL